MFRNCSSLTSLNLSSFIISKVTTMESMFKDCISLTSLNVSNFENIGSLKTAHAFKGCTNLEYINFKNINEKKVGYAIEMFDGTPDNVVVCMKENNNPYLISNEIKKKICHVNYCLDDWKSKQKKIIDGTNSCVEICDINEYKYEYNGKCYENCKNGVLISDTDLTTKECKCELEQCLLCPQVALNKNICTKCNYNYYKKENDLFNIGEYINCFKDPEG